MLRVVQKKIFLLIFFFIFFVLFFGVLSVKTVQGAAEFCVCEGDATMPTQGMMVISPIESSQWYYCLNQNVVGMNLMVSKTYDWGCREFGVTYDSTKKFTVTGPYFVDLDNEVEVYAHLNAMGKTTASNCLGSIDDYLEGEDGGVFGGHVDVTNCAVRWCTFNSDGNLDSDCSSVNWAGKTSDVLFKEITSQWDSSGELKLCAVDDNWYLLSSYGDEKIEEDGTSYVVEGKEGTFFDGKQMTLLGRVSLKGCQKKAIQSKQKFGIFKAACVKNGLIYRYSSLEEVSGIFPVDLFTKKMTAKIELDGDNPEMKFSLDQTYGTHGLVSRDWSCLDCAIAKSDIFVEGEETDLVLRKDVWKETGDYEIQPVLKSTITDDYLGAQTLDIKVVPWKINVFVDCQKRVEDKGCKEPTNQKVCEEMCEKDSFCGYMGRNQCVDKKNKKVTDIEKVNWLADQNYKMSEDYEGPLPPCAFTGTCRDTNELVFLLVKIADFFFGIIGSVSFLFFIAGGFMMIISFGNTDRVTAGRKMMTAAITGMVIAFSAYLLVNFFLNMMGVDASFRIIK